MPFVGMDARRGAAAPDRGPTAATSPCCRGCPTPSSRRPSPPAPPPASSRCSMPKVVRDSSNMTAPLRRRRVDGVHRRIPMRTDVEHEGLDQVAPAEGAVRLVGIARWRDHGHGLEPGIEGGADAGRFVAGVDAVVELAVVEHGHDRQPSLEIPQVGLGLEVVVPRPVVAERDGAAVRGVDVVTQVHEEVEVVVGGHDPVGGVATVELLAGRPGEPHPVRRRSGRRRRAEPSDGAGDAADREPVVEPTIRRQRVDRHLHGVGGPVGRHGRPARHHDGEIGGLGHLPHHREVLATGRGGPAWSR